jgi:heat shock protein HtpX
MGINSFKTVIFLTLLTILFIFIGGLIGGKEGMTVAFIFAILMNFFSYWFSDKIVLKMYRAKEINETENPTLFRIVRRLITRANIPMPKVYIINTPTPNAFATGRNPQHAAVAVTTGIMQLLDEKELEGVLGHELAHVKNRDILIGTIAATIAGAIMMLANMAKWSMFFGGLNSNDSDNRNPAGLIVMLVVAILAPIAAMLVQMAISRSREYIADEKGAKYCGDPLALASALRKISYGAEKIPMQTNPATAHMFIINPLKGQSVANLFSTHPPVEERIKRLENLARTY